MGIRAESLQASIAAVPSRSGSYGVEVVVERRGSRMLVSATKKEGRVIEVVSRTRIATQQGISIWLRSGSDRLSRLRAVDGTALGLG